MQWIQYPQENGAAQIADAIAALEGTAWPQQGEEGGFPSARETYVTSFVLLEDGRAICHAGVRRSVLYHRGERYMAYGLSEVVTHPRYQNRGLGSQAIGQAARFIMAQPSDLSIFTCARERVGFYTRGGWEAVPGACFVGGTQKNPFRSDSLQLVTMMRFISPKSRRHRKDFENADIYCELGENQLW